MRHPGEASGTSARFGPTTSTFSRHGMKEIITEISKENALFPLPLPCPIGGPAAFRALGAGRIRLGHRLSHWQPDSNGVHACGCERQNDGYAQQKAEIGSLFAGAFGWRAIARELVSKIPFGAGVIPKAAISFAGRMWSVHRSKGFTASGTDTRQSRGRMRTSGARKGQRNSRNTGQRVLSRQGLTATIRRYDFHPDSSRCERG